MLSSRRNVSFAYAGYCGKYLPIGASIDNLPCASSCNTATAVNAFVLLPI